VVIYLFIVFSPCPVSSSYIEGTDTTDANGFSHDSAFRVQGTDVWMASGLKMTGYFQKFYEYTFEDIKKAPDTFMFSLKGCPLNSRFIIQRKKDSTYSKFTTIPY
jgi:hypothetical protein